MRQLFLILIPLSVLALPVFGASERTVDLAAADLVSEAQRLHPGETMVVTGVELAEDRAVSLELQRINVFSADAQILVRRPNGLNERVSVPRNIYFSGGIAGDPTSRASLAVLKSGEIRGIVSTSSGFWMVGHHLLENRDLGPLGVRRVEELDLAARQRDFRCGQGHLEPQAAAATSLLEAPLVEALVERATSPRLAAKGGQPSYTARVAIETDVEFYSLFGNAGDASDYIGDIYAYLSTIYSADVDTSLEVTHIQLWDSTDPWVEGSTICGLFEFGRYWNDNNGSIDRTIAHYMSGKNNGGGVAWVGVLCSGSFNQDISQFGCGSLTPSVDNYGGAYGYSGTLDGDFDINNPTVLWDIVVVAHEIGHNFDSPHSHCYAGLGGDASPVDECHAGQCGQSGCHCGGTSLPGPSGQGSGTIMSYCHLLSPGISNIAMTFGPGHIYGTAPERVAERMNDHVVAMAAGSSCLDFFQPSLIFTDGFESGDTTAWSN